MRWIKKISIADYVTLANGLLGFLAITYIIDGKFTIAYFLLFTCILIDGLDGRIARYFKSKHHYGQYIDSFSDAISFCFAPAILLYSNFYIPAKGTALMSFDNALAVFVPILFLSFGIMRLARFAASGYKEKNFLGMPSPAAAFLVINLCMLFGVNGLITTNEYLVISAAFFAALLMISDVPYPKIDSALFVPSAIAVGISIISSALLVFLLVVPVVLVFTIIAFIFIFVYLVGGPLYVRVSEREFIRPKEI